MAQVVYSREALRDLERAVQFLLRENRDAALPAVEAIREAITVLENHPLVGRRVQDELRELVISYGATGYVALYRFLPVQERVRILRLRHQRELDYPV